MKTEFKSQAAKDAKQMSYGNETYWMYLDQSAQDAHEYYLRHGLKDIAETMLTRSLAEALSGNNGD